MKNKIFMGIFLCLILMVNVSFASYQTVTMSVVEEPVCTIQLGQNSKFEKKLIEKDLSNKEVTLQLQVTNNEIADKPTGEIMLVLDNSVSMNNPVSGNTTRKELIFGAAKSLVSNLLEGNDQLKIGIVRFSTSVTAEGTLNDASIVSPLSSDANALNHAIDAVETNGPRTNLHSGLLLASEQFTNEDNNKYMIVFTDGIPNVAVDYDKTYYSNDVITKTNEQLKAVEAKGIQLITMLSGINDETTIPNTTTKNFGQIIKEVFGTEANPTAGKFYYVTDAEVEKTIKEDIYQSLVSLKKSLKDITVVDYFPEEIVKNFDFAYVSNANIGTISSKVDTENNSITWTIPELANGETATVQYKLKLKENFDSSIINKVLNTNEKVDITYTDFDGKEQSKTSTISPKLLLEEPPANLPKAGTLSSLLIGFTGLAITLLVYSMIKLVVVNHKLK